MCIQYKSQNEWRMNTVSACNAFLNAIQRLRLKSAFLYTKTITKFDHDETYKLGHGPRTNTNHVHIFRLCKKHLQSLKRKKSV